MRRLSFLIFTAILLLAGQLRAETVAVIDNNDHPMTAKFSAALRADLLRTKKLVDDDAARAAFGAFAFANPINLTTGQAIAAAQAVGCDLLVLISGGATRRVSSARPEYYEAFAAVFAISARSGRLVHFSLRSAEEDAPAIAEKKLLLLTRSTADDVIRAFSAALAIERESRPSVIEELAEAAPASRSFQPPMPYRRIKPEYTTQAYLHWVAASVEILVDVDETGRITRTEISRWAGYGLDEAVDAAVRAMNWRPAHRNGKPLAMRVLLRYNFREIGPRPQ